MNFSVSGHIAIMLVGAVAVLIAAYVAATDSGDKRINWHKTAALVGVLVFVLGAVGVLLAGAANPGIPHFYGAIGSLLLFLLAVLGGYLYTKAEPSKKATLRKGHRLDAISAVVLLLITVILGMIARGII